MFGNSTKKVETRLIEVQRLVDPAQANSIRSISKINEMGMAAALFDSANNTYQNSSKGRGDRSRVLSALKDVEAAVRKAMK